MRWYSINGRQLRDCRQLNFGLQRRGRIIFNHCEVPAPKESLRGLPDAGRFRIAACLRLRFDSDVRTGGRPGTRIDTIPAHLATGRKATSSRGQSPNRPSAPWLPEELLVCRFAYRCDGICQRARGQRRLKSALTASLKSADLLIDFGQDLHKPYARCGQESAGNVGGNPDDQAVQCWIFP